jgi:hypothetical protein
MYARCLVGALATIMSASCGQSGGVPPRGQAADPPTADDALSRQVVDADVAAIIAGMAFANGVRAVVVRLPQ